MLLFADAGQGFLGGGPAEVPAVLATHAIFHDASGLGLSLPKCALLPVGLLPADTPPPGSAMCGIPVVAAATALGLTFTNGLGEVAGADWDARVAAVLDRHDKVARLQTLSAMGRGLAASGYGVSRLLYHAEFAGMPPAAALTRLRSATARLVDGGHRPSDRERHPTGVPHALLAGSPADGGFGLLPWVEHIRARHAAWGARLVAGAAVGDAEQQPWVRIGRRVLDLHMPGVAVTPAALLHYNPADHSLLGAAGATLPEGPLRRLAGGLAALPPCMPVPPEDLGPWCHDAPLWGNPLLPDVAAAAAPGLHLVPDLATVGGLWDLLQATRLDRHHPARFASAVRPRLAAAANFPGMRHAGEVATRLQLVWTAVPRAWRDAVEAAVEALQLPGGVGPPGCAIAYAELVRRVRWAPGQAERLPPAAAAAGPAGDASAGGRLRLASFSVRMGTNLQMRVVRAAREARVLEFVRAALPAATPLQVAEGVEEVFGLFARVWRQLRWENGRKEGWWRLVLDGFAVYGRLQGPWRAKQCECGGQAPGTLADRDHHFWRCPVATAVRDAMQRELGAGVLLGRENVWLMRPPAGMHGGLWIVVCLAAVEAMAKGRGLMQHYALRRLSGLPAPDSAAWGASAGRRAVAAFWAFLDDFASAPWDVRVPVGGRAASAFVLPAGHPFFAGSSSSLSVRRPPAGGV
jgi:hypothetical protein